VAFGAHSSSCLGCRCGIRNYTDDQIMREMLALARLSQQTFPIISYNLGEPLGVCGNMLAIVIDNGFGGATF
jgi:hypothetical protein